MVQLSDELTAFFNGVFEMPRTEVTKKMWEYIKSHNLQNPSNKREILCDEKLEKLFKRKKVDMFKMTKLLSEVSSSSSSSSSSGSSSSNNNNTPTTNCDYHYHYYHHTQDLATIITLTTYSYIYFYC